MRPLRWWPIYGAACAGGGGVSAVCILTKALPQSRSLAICRAEAFGYLQSRGQPALIACPIRGKDGGTRAFCQGNRSYRTVHTFQNAQGQTFTAEIAVCRVFTTAKRTARHQRRGEWLVFVLMGVGFILLNLWVKLCWEFTQVARRGGRFLNAELFRQQRFINFLIHALEQLYGRISNITAPAPPLL
jgi:hypothetical protein